MTPPPCGVHQPRLPGCRFCSGVALADVLRAGDLLTAAVDGIVRGFFVGSLDLGDVGRDRNRNRSHVRLPFFDEGNWFCALGAKVLGTPVTHLKYYRNQNICQAIFHNLQPNNKKPLISKWFFVVVKIKLI